VLRISTLYNQQPYVTVVPFGKRLYTLTLPQWVGQLSPGHRSTRPEFENYLAWMREDVPSSFEMDISQATQPNLGKIENDVLCCWLCHAYNLGNHEQRPDWIIAQMRVLNEWYRRNQNAEQIDLHYALMAVVLYRERYDFVRKNKASFVEETQLGNELVQDMLADWNRISYNLLRELGQRALSSMHIEVLAMVWLFQPARAGSLWVNLGEIQKFFQQAAASREADMFLALKSSELTLVRRFCRLISLHYLPDSDIVDIANALSTSIGHANHFNQIQSKADNLGKLVRVYRSLLPLPPSKGSWQGGIHRSQINRLRSILNGLKNRSLDITLAKSVEIRISRDGKI
jgi:hypothetical protein